MKRLLLVQVLLLVIGCVPAWATLPEGYYTDVTLFSSDFEAMALDVFPSSGGWQDIEAKFRAEDFFRVVKDPVRASNQVLWVPSVAPGEADNTYIGTPALTTTAQLIHVEFDLYMASSKYAANPYAGVYLFGIDSWPPHAQIYIRPDKNNVTLDVWTHYDWIINLKENNSLLFVDGKQIGTATAFRTNDLDPASFRAGIWGTVSLLNVYYDNFSVKALSQ